MPTFQSISELCAVAALTKNIPDAIVLIQDQLALFLKRTKLTFPDRPDELTVGMEVWCNQEPGYMAGIIRYIDPVQPHNRLNLINVELYHAHPSAIFKNYTRNVVLNAENVFQLFQSTVETYNITRRYGFLNYKNKRSYFFHASGVIINMFRNTRIEVGQVVNHTIKYNFHERSQTMDIIAHYVHPL